MSLVSDRHTLAVFMCCKDCCELIKESLPRLLWADEIILADVSITSDIKDFAAYLDPKIKYFHLTEDDFNRRLMALLPHISSDYVLVVDTDEFYTTELADEILDALRMPCQFEGFYVPVVNYLFGTCFGLGNPFMRLWRKDAAIIPLAGSAHTNITVRGPKTTLKHAYDHIDNPKLSIVAVKHFRYSSITASRMTDSDLDQRRLNRLGGLRLWLHSLTSLARLNVRFLRVMYQHRQHGFAGLCTAYHTVIRVIAEDVSPTDEWKMRKGLTERSNRGYW